jgi:SAM-dependent methyltransferase
VCEQDVRFNALGDWYRDQLLCSACFSLPRQRALMRVVRMLYPNWCDLSIHESSPSRDGASKILRQSPGYIETAWEPHKSPSERNLNLEEQSFADEMFDLVITQDVFEHIFDPAKAIREIARTLKPGGAHIMSVPIVNKQRPSERRALPGKHLREPQYHDSPRGKCLVTVDWGYDIADFLALHSGLPTTIMQIEDRQQGITGEFLDIVVSRKGCAPVLHQSAPHNDL